VGCVYLSNVLWTAVGVKSIFGVLYRFMGGRAGCEPVMTVSGAASVYIAALIFAAVDESPRLEVAEC
jgi:hypothetical protein